MCPICYLASSSLLDVCATWNHTLFEFCIWAPAACCSGCDANYLFYCRCYFSIFSFYRFYASFFNLDRFYFDFSSGLELGSFMSPMMGVSSAGGARCGRCSSGSDASSVAMGMSPMISDCLLSSWPRTNGRYGDGISRS